MDFPRGRAAALVERLTALGEKTLDLAIENRRLRAALAARSDRPNEAGGEWFDDPRDTHPWPYMANSGHPPDHLHDHRADDDLVRVAADGEAFLRAFDLLGPAPGFDAAIAALNATPRRLAGAHGPGRRTCRSSSPCTGSSPTP